VACVHFDFHNINAIIVRSFVLQIARRLLVGSSVSESTTEVAT
jgi:hypothetical protein